MNDLTEIQSATLPALIDRAAGALTAAKNSAEVLEARDLARVAYDAAKSAGRMAKAKRAHEEVIAAVYRAQADALLIEARAKMRLADEYDEAQERGEVARNGDNLPSVADPNSKKPTASDLGLRRDEIHDARGLRDAEKADPGKAERALKDMVDRGEEPTKAKLRQEVKPDAAPEPPKEKEPKHILKLRREFRSLTPEAQEDEWIGIHLDLNDEKAKRKAAQAEVRKLREINKELSAEDKNAVAVRYESKLANMREQKRIANDNFAAEKNKTYRLNKEVEHLKKKITELERQLENQEFTL